MTRLPDLRGHGLDRPPRTRRCFRCCGLLVATSRWPTSRGSTERGGEEPGMTGQETGLLNPRVAELREHVSAYRILRGELEQAILPLASSLDGLTFEFQASLHDLPYRSGGYVVLESPGGWRLGQVVTLETSTYAAAAEVAPGAGTDATIRHARGGGRGPETGGTSLPHPPTRPAAPP